MREKRIAAKANETPLAMNAASRPKTDAKTPPIAAPTASMTPHVEPSKEFAAASSSLSRAMFGIEASVAGLMTAARAEIVL